MGIIISNTAKQSGYGRDRWKSVTGLTSTEKDLLEKGVTIAFCSAKLSGGNHGTYWRVVKFSKSGSYCYFDSRVPNTATLEKLEQLKIVKGKGGERQWVLKIHE